MAVTIVPGETLSVEIAFGSTPLNTSPSWTDVTTYVFSVDITRGRTDEFSQYSPGSASVVLNNSTRNFDPYFTTGPYYGLLVPMTPIRIVGNGYTVFSGFVSAWPTVYDTSNNFSTSTIPCTDAMRFFSNSYLSSSAFTKLVLADSTLMNFYPMQSVEPIGITCTKTGAVLTMGVLGTETITSNFPAGATTMLTAGSSYNATQTYWTNSNVTTSAPRTIEFWIDGRSQKNNYSEINVVLRGSNAGLGYEYKNEFDLIIGSDGIMSSIVYSNEATNRNGATYTAGPNLRPLVGANHVVVTTDTTNLYIYVNSVLSRTIALSAGTNSGFPQNNETIIGSTALSNIAFYNAQLSAATILDHYNAGVGYPNELSSTRLTRVCDDIGWPASSRSFETGVQAVGSYRPTGQASSGYLRQIENAEQGSIFVNRSGSLTFKNRTTTSNCIPVVVFFSDETSATYPYADIDIDSNNIDKIFNVINGPFENGTATQSDSTSVTSYGPQAQSIDLVLMSSRTDADAACSAMLNKYKNPQLTVQTLTINMRNSSAYLNLLPSLELADDVTVRFQPMKTGNVIWRALRIQGIAHSIRMKEWFVTLYLSSSTTNTNGPLFILDNSTYGLLNGTSVLG